MALKSWAVPVGLGLLTMVLGCSSNKAETDDAGLPAPLGNCRG
jgi:hypothetical protein